jgi:hypothetical protein
VSDTPDFRDLVGSDLSPEEELELARVDALLRSVPAPAAEVPDRLARAVERIGTTTPLWTRRRVALALALAASVAALFFGVGRWMGSGFDAQATVLMQPGAAAPAASAKIELGSRDEYTGNWKLKLTVDGLPHLGQGRYYVLWLAKNGKYAGTCGTFDVHGRTTVDMTASYDLGEYDEWVISQAEPGSPQLLTARTT